MKIASVAGKIESTWLDDVKAVLDTWTSYFVTLDEFKACVLDKGVPFAKAHGGMAWIVDSSAAKGVFSKDIQAFIASDVFPAFKENGIEYFITIDAQSSALTKMTVASYSAKAGPLGLKLLSVASVDDAKEWLKANA